MADPNLTARAAQLLDRLRAYRQGFNDAVTNYDGTTHHAAELEEVMASYSGFVTDDAHEAPFAELEQACHRDLDPLVIELRAQSARGAAVMEKYRALRLLEGRAGSAGYFANVEECIEEEFGAMAPTDNSEVLLVGSGSFPMTLLNIATRTGASVAGVDIDPEAVELGRRVVMALGGDLAIGLATQPVEHLPFTRRASHIVFSSTVSAKYDLLHRIHPITRDDVVVAMRFGNGLKSLFNYPAQAVDPARWLLTETVSRPGRVFDIGVYVKARAAGKEEHRR